MELREPVVLLVDFRIPWYLLPLCHPPRPTPPLCSSVSACAGCLAGWVGDMLCTLRPVSNLLSLALSLTDHLHSLTAPKIRDTECMPLHHRPLCQHSSPPLFHTHSHTHTNALTHHPHIPRSASHGGRNTFRDFASLPPFDSAVSLHFYHWPSEHPLKCSFSIHPPTPAVSLVSFHSSLFLKDSISQSLWLAGISIATLRLPLATTGGTKMLIWPCNDVNTDEAVYNSLQVS